MTEQTTHPFAQFEPQSAEQLQAAAKILAPAMPGEDVTPGNTLRAMLRAKRLFGSVWEAAERFTIIKGKPFLLAESARALLYREAASVTIETATDDEAKITATRNDGRVHTAHWTIKRAKQERVFQVSKPDAKAPTQWETRPGNMLLSRCYTELISHLLPDVYAATSDAADFVAEAAAVQREAETLPAEVPPPRPGATPSRAETPAPVTATPTQTVSPVDLVTSLVAECGYADDAAFMAALADYLRALDPTKANTIASQWQAASASQVADWSAKIRDRLLPPLVEPVAETTVEPVAEVAAMPEAQAEAQPALLVETVVPPAPPAAEGKQPTSPATLIRREIKRLVEAGLVIWRDEETTSAYLKGCTPEGRAELWSIIDAHTTDSARAAELVSLGGIRKL